MGQLTEILRRLYHACVEFSLIGGLASVHYGVIKSKLALGRDRDLAAVQQLRAIKEKVDSD